MGYSGGDASDALDSLGLGKPRLERSLLGHIPADRGEAHSGAALVAQNGRVPDDQTGRSAAQMKRPLEMELRLAAIAPSGQKGRPPLPLCCVFDALQPTGSHERLRRNTG